MKIALIGYGKMGKAIERFALSRGHEVTVRIDVDNQEDFNSEAFRNSDVAIEFTTPATAAANCRRALEAGVKVVSGSTGWAAQMPEIEQLCKATGGAMLWSSNFSIGVNLFMAVNRYLAKMMNAFPQYIPSMTEVHHIHKLDHPSGTAITLAEGIIESNSRTERWTEDAAQASAEDMLIDHRREGEVPGIHNIRWDSPVDTITIEHSAKSRDGFALGAVMAAEWVAQHTGWLNMNMFMNEMIHGNN